MGVFPISVRAAQTIVREHELPKALRNLAHYAETHDLGVPHALEIYISDAEDELAVTLYHD